MNLETAGVGVGKVLYLLQIKDDDVHLPDP